MKVKLKHLKDFIKFISAKIISLFIKKKSNIYLIGERKDEAKDNGYHLFKYIRTNYPNEKVYYVLDKNSNDFNKVSKYGNIIIYGSIKHYIYICIAEKFICAHLGSCLSDTPIIWKAKEQKLIKGKSIFIQHGITISDHEALKYENSGMDIFVCGGNLEYEYVRDNFGYPKGSVKYLGFCRFDNLHNFEVKNQILIMPTWRGWLGATWGGEDYDKFLDSEYYKRFKSLINNNKLIDFLEKNNLNLIFYPHYEMQKYIQFFEASSNKVIIADKENYDVQQLLKESKVLITDYSSVAFDFAYMKKPIIYYQFDSEEYYRKHYNKGYFNYEKDGFGPVAYDEKYVIEYLYNIYVEKKNIYLDRVNVFFQLYDEFNCERTYREIILD